MKIRSESSSKNFFLDGDAENQSAEVIFINEIFDSCSFRTKTTQYCLDDWIFLGEVADFIQRKQKDFNCPSITSSIKEKP